jgi:predicted outer membrane repeat protein
VALHSGGGIHVESQEQIALYNVLIYDDTVTHSSGKGGGIYIKDVNRPNFYNSTISGNNANIGLEIYYDNIIQSIFRSSIVWNGSGNAVDHFGSPNLMYLYSLVEGKTSSTSGNLSGSINPEFIDPASGNYRLEGGSPCIDAGFGSGYTPTDLDEKPRMYGNSVDMGAYEYNVLPSGGVIYVKKGGSGLQHDGSSWDNAVAEFSVALWAKSMDPAIQQIWVSDGIYYPVAITGFVLPNSTRIYGGFPSNASNGVHTSTAYPIRPVNGSNFGGTVLRGHIGGNPSNKSCHTVFAGGYSHLDGFIIDGGMAYGTGYDIINGTWVPRNYGGGIYVTDQAELRNLDIHGNHGQFGGGMAIVGTATTAAGAGGNVCAPRLENITTDNNVAQFGGGIYAKQSALYAKDIHVFNNSAERGGGIYCHSMIGGADGDDVENPIMPIFENSSIHDNFGESKGGGIYNASSMPLFYNLLIYNNNGDEDDASGTAIYNDYGATIGIVHATITNTISVPQPEIENHGIFYLNNSLVCLNGFNSSGLTLGNNHINSSICPGYFIDPYIGNFALTASPPFLTTNLYNVHGMIANMMQQDVVLSCQYFDMGNTWLLSDIAGELRPNANNLVNYGAYEYDPNIHFHTFHTMNPFWKSADDNKEEENLSQDAVDWKLQAYPNPVSSGQQITVSLEKGNLLYEKQVNIHIFSIEGALLYSKTCPTGRFDMTVPQLAAGIYIMHLKTENGERYTTKLVIR